MRNYLLGFILILYLCTVVSAQSFFDDLNLAKKIQLLESDETSVISLFGKHSLTIGRNADSMTFYRPDSVVYIWFSKDRCRVDDDTAFMTAADWNVDEGKVTLISIAPKGKLPVKNVGIDLKNFLNEQLYSSKKDHRIYHNKTSGTAVSTWGEYVDRVHFFPSLKDHPRLCEDKNIRKFYASKKWRRNSENKHSIYDPNFPASVTELTVTVQDTSNRLFKVNTTAYDPENDVLTYFYKPSGGQIEGTGANVVWDLTEVEPGTYEITAAVNDGCGFCGYYKTVKVNVK